MGAKRSFKNLEASVVGAWIDATMARIGVPGCEGERRMRSSQSSIDMNGNEFTLCGLGIP